MMKYKTAATLSFLLLLNSSCQTTSQVNTEKNNAKREGLIRFIFTQSSSPDDFSLMRQLAFDEIEKICKNKVFKIDEGIPLYLASFISYENSFNIQVQNGKKVKTEFKKSESIFSQNPENDSAHLDFLLYYACAAE